MKSVLLGCGVLLISLVALAQSPSPAATAGANNNSGPQPAVTAQEVQQLRDALAAQQQQIDQLRQELAERDASSSRPHAPNLGQVASTSPMIPAGSPATEATVPGSLPAPQEKPAAAPPAAISLAAGKLQIGAVAYADWGIYPQTGFGPVFLDTPHVYPGPGNDGYNSFNLNRTYINFLFSPTDWVTFRITPDIYRDINGAAGVALSATSTAGATPNGSLNLRLKYGYAEFHKIFSGAFKDDNIRFGQQTNPMIDWQEALYDYRFVSLVPWNFISLSSTYTGVSINGPIKGSNGKQYVDYQIGVFNNSNFHAFEVAENKTVMARASLYPMGATSRFQGLGLTGFIDYGYNNKAPEAAQVQTPVVRGSALIHYQSPHNGAQIAFEYMFGRNAFSTGNLFGGGAPGGAYALMGSLAGAILAPRNAKQQGFDVFGHINLGPSKWALFGLYQSWQPNTHIPTNPLDFNRIVAGISYRVNKNVRLAFDSQDVLYKRDQFTYPAATLATFSPALATANPGGIPNAVPPSVKALFVNMEFTF